MEGSDNTGTGRWRCASRGCVGTWEPPLVPVQLELWGSALARFKEVETDGELHLLRCTAAAMGEMRIGKIFGTRRRRLYFGFF